MRQLDKRIARGDELSDSEDEDNRRNESVEIVDTYDRKTSRYNQEAEYDDMNDENSNSPGESEERDLPAKR
jgi:hypothetical protein